MNIKIDNFYLCSFASPDLEKSKKRFLSQAKNIGVYKKVKVFGIDDLSVSTRKQIENFFKNKKKIINKWFNDLFKWLFKCEKIFGFSKLKGYDQERLYAYLAERYLSFWFRKYTKHLEWHWTFYEHKE